MTWKVEFDPRAFTELKKLDKQIQLRIVRFIKQRIELSDDCRIIGIPLKGTLGGLWKYRVGDYRLICQIEHKKFCVLIVNVGHRKNIYKKIKWKGPFSGRL
jgi:addiction module toxin, RelE/StbE family